MIKLNKIIEWSTPKNVLKNTNELYLPGCQPIIYTYFFYKKPVEGHSTESFLILL